MVPNVMSGLILRVTAGARTRRTIPGRRAGAGTAQRRLQGDRSSCGATRGRPRHVRGWLRRSE